MILITLIISITVIILTAIRYDYKYTLLNNEQDSIPVCSTCKLPSPHGNICEICYWKAKYLEARQSGYEEGRKEMKEDLLK